MSSLFDASYIKEKLERVGNSPGVYLFRDEKENIIYVGKAVQLRNRLRSYFRPLFAEDGEASDIKTKFLIQRIYDFETIITDSENEALILESVLIKKHQPRYNVRLKDDKRYPYICVTTGEPYPRLLVTRKINRSLTGESKNSYFGPYTDVRYIRQTVDILHKLFKVRSCRLKLPEQKLARPCLEYDLGRCDAPCVDYVSQREYGQQINMLLTFLQGETVSLKKSLREQIEAHVRNLEFEKAAEKRDLLLGLEALGSSQRVDSRTKDNRDIVAAAREGGEFCVVLFRVRNGILIEKKPYFFQGESSFSAADYWHAFWRDIYMSMERDFIPGELYIAGDEPMPEEYRNGLMEKVEQKLVVRNMPLSHESDKDSEIEPRETSEIRDNSGQYSDIRGLLRLAQRNASMELQEEINKKQFRAKRSALREIALKMGLKHPPQTIECFDISTLQGSYTVASLVSFSYGEPNKKRYRRFKIGSGNGEPNDFASMHEAVSRYFSRLAMEEEPFPDLLLVDGGKGQLKSALQAFEDLGLHGQVPVAGLAKREEQIFVPEQKEPLTWEPGSRGMLLLRSLRDEAHRFAVTYHRKQRERDELSVEVAEIPGIGEKMSRKLLQEVGGVGELAQLTYGELTEIPGIGPKQAQKIREYFAKKLEG